MRLTVKLASCSAMGVFLSVFLCFSHSQYSAAAAAPGVRMLLGAPLSLICICVPPPEHRAVMEAAFVYGAEYQFVLTMGGTVLQHMG